MQSQDENLVKHFRKQLAACVRTIRWSYAIFWSLSTRKEGLLEWNDGYYNGDIKTRKTTQITDYKTDQLGLQRSEQLRELYESLSTGDRNLQNKRPSASLSPEDLTDAEWYYLVCMSFTFNLGQDLPGKVYECNEPIWLCNAELSENRTFCRSLLAKSASIQTVVCLPFMDGVLEFGTSDLVMKDADFVQNITSSFWELQLPVFSENSASSPPLDHEVEGAKFLENPALITENCSHVFPFAVDSNASNKEADFILENATDHRASLYEEMIYTPNDSSNVPNKSAKMMDRLSEVQMRHLMDDELSNGFHEHLNYGILTSPRGERVKRNMLEGVHLDKHAHLGSFDADGDESHYASTLSAILVNSKEQSSFPSFHFTNCPNGSSFSVWKGSSKASKIYSKTPQRMLKKILINGKWMNDSRLIKHQEEKEESVPRSKSCKLEADDTNANHVLSERRRREKLNEKFLILRTLVPSISKVDKASILADTIEYLKELEKRVEELECCKEETDLGFTKRSSYPDVAERTSDNYGNNSLNCRRVSTKRRKSCEINEVEGEHPSLSTKDVVDINVTMIEKEVLVEMHCPLREFLLLDIVEAMSKIHLDPHSMQATTIDGNLAITVQAKFMNTVVASPGMIKRALQRVVAK